MELMINTLNDLLITYFNLIVMFLFTQFIRVMSKVLIRAEEDGSDQFYTTKEKIITKHLKHWMGATHDYMKNHQTEMKTRGLKPFRSYLRRSLRREVGIEVADQITMRLEDRILVGLNKKEGLQLGNVVSPFGTEYGKISASYRFRF